MKLHLEQREEEVTRRWVRCGGRWEVTKSLKLSRGWVGLKPHCKPLFPLRQEKLEGWDGTGLQGRTWGHFITESVCPEDGKRIILQTGFIAGDNSLAKPTVGKCHIGWGYNIASFTAPNSLIFSNACVEMCVYVCEFVKRYFVAFVRKWMCMSVSTCMCLFAIYDVHRLGLYKRSVAKGIVTWTVFLLLTWCVIRYERERAKERLMCWLNN